MKNPPLSPVARTASCATAASIVSAVAAPIPAGTVRRACPLPETGTPTTMTPARSQHGGNHAAERPEELERGRIGDANEARHEGPRLLPVVSFAFFPIFGTGNELAAPSKWGRNRSRLAAYSSARSGRILCSVRCDRRTGWKELADVARKIAAAGDDERVVGHELRVVSLRSGLGVDRGTDRDRARVDRGDRHHDGGAASRLRTTLRIATGPTCLCELGRRWPSAATTTELAQHAPASTSSPPKTAS